MVQCRRISRRTLIREIAFQQHKDYAQYIYVCVIVYQYHNIYNLCTNLYIYIYKIIYIYWHRFIFVAPPSVVCNLLEQNILLFLRVDLYIKRRLDKAISTNLHDFPTSCVLMLYTRKSKAMHRNRRPTKKSPTCFFVHRRSGIANQFICTQATYRRRRKRAVMTYEARTGNSRIVSKWDKRRPRERK